MVYWLLFNNCVCMCVSQVPAEARLHAAVRQDVWPFLRDAGGRRHRCNLQCTGQVMWHLHHAVKSYLQYFSTKLLLSKMNIFILRLGCHNMVCVMLIQALYWCRWCLIILHTYCVEIQSQWIMCFLNISCVKKSIHNYFLLFTKGVLWTVPVG